MAKQLLFWSMAMTKGQRNVGHVIEFPADEASPMEGTNEWLSFGKTEMWKSFKSISGMTMVTFNQGAYGHQAIRPTTLATTYPMISYAEGD